ncbi:MAG: hypothetical protein ABDI20_01240, partial [Candidatus Bipolaricaulaceae bacterium]
LLHRLGASGACIVYTAYSNGTEDAFAVINTVEGGHVLHLYPDGEQRWLLHDGLGILEQLRRNERYRKFEGWLKSGGLGGPADVWGVQVGPVLVDEGTGITHVFLTALGSSLNPSVSPPLDTVAAAFLVLARVFSRQGAQLALDSENLHLLPLGSLSVRPLGDLSAGALEIVRVGSGEAYTVMAGGDRPSNWAGLRNFAWYSPLPDYDARLISGSGIRSASTWIDALGGWALTVFVWGLADYPDANMLIQFKTEGELTSRAQSAIKASRDYGVLSVKAVQDSSSFVPLAGLGVATLAGFERSSSQGQALIGRQYAEFDARVIAKDIEFLTGLTLEQIGELFLTLAAAHDQGEF